MFIPIVCTYVCVCMSVSECKRLRKDDCCQFVSDLDTTHVIHITSMYVNISKPVLIKVISFNVMYTTAITTYIYVKKTKKLRRLKVRN